MWLSSYLLAVSAKYHWGAGRDEFVKSTLTLKIVWVAVACSSGYSEWCGYVILKFIITPYL